MVYGGVTDIVVTYLKVGLVHSKYMQGGVGKNDDDDSPGALTSYILIAMLEAGANKTVSIISSSCLSVSL